VIGYRRGISPEGFSARLRVSPCDSACVVAHPPLHSRQKSKQIVLVRIATLAFFFLDGIDVRAK
jgi:hypothetical protein